MITWRCRETPRVQYVPSDADEGLHYIMIWGRGAGELTADADIMILMGYVTCATRREKAANSHFHTPVFSHFPAKPFFSSLSFPPRPPNLPDMPTLPQGRLWVLSMFPFPILISS